MRVITLPKDRDEAKKAFNLIYTAAFAGEGAKDMATARKLGKLQDALDAASHDEDVTKEEAAGTDQKTKRVREDYLAALRAVPAGQSAKVRAMMSSPPSSAEPSPTPKR